MKKKICKWQTKCVEDTDDTWTCTAHLAESLVFACPYDENNIKVIDGEKIMTQKGKLIGQCQDWEEEGMVEEKHGLVICTGSRKCASGKTCEHAKPHVVQVLEDLPCSEYDYCELPEKRVRCGPSELLEDELFEI